MFSGKTIDNILKKKFTSDEVVATLGHCQQAYMSYALDADIRSKAASGGSVTALLIYLLEQNEITGAIVCRSKRVDGKIRAYFEIAKTRDDILKARGSKYIATNFLKEVCDLIKSSSDTLAIVGLPCDISHLKRWLENNPEQNKKVLWTIGLLCGQNSKTDYVDAITEDLEKRHQQKIKSFTFREDHWRGNSIAEFENGQSVRVTYSKYEDYRNLYFFTEDKCHSCTDHFAYKSDISAGDLWLFRLKKSKIKHTGLITRHARASKLIEECHLRGALHAEKIPIEMMMEAQQRTGPYHYRISARSQAGRRLGFKIIDNIHQTVKWHHWLNAYISLFSARWSSDPVRKKQVFKIPRPLIKLMLYFKKALESLP